MPAQGVATGPVHSSSPKRYLGAPIFSAERCRSAQIRPDYDLVAALAVQDRCIGVFRERCCGRTDVSGLRSKGAWPHFAPRLGGLDPLAQEEVAMIDVSPFE